MANVRTQGNLERATYTIEEVASILGVGRSTAYDAARRGEIPTVRLGRRLLVPKAKLDEMLGEKEDA